jgi:hypothetical protein
MAINLSKKSHNVVLYNLPTKLNDAYHSIANLIVDYLLQSDDILSPESLPHSLRDSLLKIIHKFSDLLTVCSDTSILWRNFIEKGNMILFEMRDILKKSNNTNVETEMHDLEEKINLLVESDIKYNLYMLNQIFYDIIRLIDQSENKIIGIQLELVSDYHLDSSLQEYMQNIFHSIKNQNNSNETNQIICDCLNEHQKILEELDLFDKTIIVNKKRYTEKLLHFQSKFESSTKVSDCIIL